MTKKAAAKKPAPKAKPAKQPKAKAEKVTKPRHNSKVMSYVAAIRAQHGAAVSAMTDHDIADKIWRFASVEKALAAFA